MTLPLPLAAMLRKQMFTRMPDVDGVNRWIRSDCIIQRFSEADKGNPGHHTVYVSITKLLGKEPQATTIYLSTSKELISAIKALGLDPLYVTRSKPKPEPEPDQLPLEIPTDSDKLADWLKEQSWVQCVDHPLAESAAYGLTGRVDTQPGVQSEQTDSGPKNTSEHVQQYDYAATRRLQAEHNAFKGNLLRSLNDPEIVNALREALKEKK